MIWIESVSTRNSQPFNAKDLKTLELEAGETLHFKYICNEDRLRDRKIQQTGIDVIMTLRDGGFVFNSIEQQRHVRVCSNRRRDGVIEFQIPKDVKENEDYFVQFQTKGDLMGKRFAFKTDDFTVVSRGTFKGKIHTITTIFCY